jgi:hypothetical protein
MIRIKFEDIDDYIEWFAVDEHERRCFGKS